MGHDRTFNDWLYKPTAEESVCVNPFHDICQKVFDGFSAFDPYAPDPESPYTKLANLLKAKLILLEGDVIYVREHDELHPLNEATSLLAYYMHTDQREARRAADILESNFQGYFPITSKQVHRDAIRIKTPNGEMLDVDLKTLVSTPSDNSNDNLFPEFGISEVTHDHMGPIALYFSIMNEAIGDEYFFEKTILYPFTQPFREKSHVLVGGGGNGKSLFMKMVQRLYGNKALTDAPQPNFKGHDAGVISYNFIGKRVVTFNDVGDPSTAFLEWMKRMITGNLEVKTPNGSWLSVPCKANFMMETNHTPQILNLEAHRRRFIIREFDPNFKLKDFMTKEELDIIGERGNITAADIVWYLMQIKDQVGDWTDFNETYDDEIAH